MKPTIGRIVHFVQAQPKAGSGNVHLPAIVVSVWSDYCVNLQVFTDGGNSDDSPDGNLTFVKWITSVTYDETGSSIRSWHWPEREK